MSETMATCMDLAAGLAVGHSLRTWNAPAGLPWPWLLPSLSRRPRSCCCGHVTASSRPCRSTPDRTSRPPSWSARATTATANSCSSPRARRSRRRCSCGSCAGRRRACAGLSAGRCSSARGPARRSRWAWPRPGSRSARSATTARSRWGSRPRTGGRGWATWPSRRPSGRSSPASAPRPRSALMRRFPRSWWIPGSVLAVGFATASHLPGPGRPGPGLQPLHGAARGPHARRRAGARPRGGGRRRPGLRGRREPAHDGLQRLRHRAGADQARGPLRQPAQGLQPRRGPPRRRPRARPRALPRRAARPALRRARGPRRALRRLAAHAAPRAAPSPGPVPRRCRRWRSRSRSSASG